MDGGSCARNDGRNWALHDSLRFGHNFYSNIYVTICHLHLRSRFRLRSRFHSAPLPFGPASLQPGLHLRSRSHLG